MSTLGLVVNDDAREDLNDSRATEFSFAPDIQAAAAAAAAAADSGKPDGESSTEALAPAAAGDVKSAGKSPSEPLPTLAAMAEWADLHGRLGHRARVMTIEEILNFWVAQ